MYIVYTVFSIRPWWLQNALFKFVQRANCGLHQYYNCQALHTLLFKLKGRFSFIWLLTLLTIWGPFLTSGDDQLKCVCILWNFFFGFSHSKMHGQDIILNAKYCWTLIILNDLLAYRQSFKTVNNKINSVQLRIFKVVAQKLLARMCPDFDFKK